MASSFLRFLDHTKRRTTVGRTPLDEWSACRRDIYLTIHNIHNRQTSMPPEGFKPMISAGERPQTYALDHAATGTGDIIHMGDHFYKSRTMVPRLTPGEPLRLWLHNWKNWELWKLKVHNKWKTSGQHKICLALKTVGWRFIRDYCLKEDIFIVKHESHTHTKQILTL